MLEQDIGDIREKLQMWRRHYPSESAVSQSIVLRLLSTLGWPIHEAQVVHPEYTLEGRRVDFALCHPADEPRIFIEAKGVGKGTGAERQLFEYAFHRGVPLAILTDGREWSFSLPAGEGSYDKRLVCKLDLSASDAAESVQRFERYLRYDAVRSGAALTNARNDYQDVVRKRRDQRRERQINEALPKAWATLVAEEDEFLIEVVADCVEGLCGHKPDSNIVARFLQDMVHQPGARPPTPSDPPRPPEEPGTAGLGFVLFDQFYPCQTQRDVLIQVFEILTERDSSFIEEFAALPQHGRTRRYIALDRSELYPGSPHLAQESRQLSSGHWIGLSVNQEDIARIVGLACKVARIGYGTDLKITLK